MLIISVINRAMVLEWKAHGIFFPVYTFSLHMGKAAVHLPSFAQVLLDGINNRSNEEKTI